MCVDFRKPNSVQIGNWVTLEKMHFLQFRTILFIEILHKFIKIIFLKCGVSICMLDYVDFDLGDTKVECNFDVCTVAYTV